MALDISSHFNSAARGCFQEASSIFQSIEGDFGQWQDVKGQNARKVVDGERKQFQAIVEEAKNVRSAMREIETLADKVESISRKKD